MRSATLIVCSTSKTCKFTNSDLLPNDHHAIGLSISRATKSSQTLDGETLVNEKVFDSSHLLLKDTSTSDYLQKISLREIERFQNVHKSAIYPLYGKCFDLKNSSIFIENEGAIVKEEAFELTFYYCTSSEKEHYQRIGLVA